MSWVVFSPSCCFWTSGARAGVGLRLQPVRGLFRSNTAGKALIVESLLWHGDLLLGIFLWLDDGERVPFDMVAYEAKFEFDGLVADARDGNQSLIADGLAWLNPTMLFENSDSDGALPLSNAVGLRRVSSKNAYRGALLRNCDLGEADVFELDGNQDIGETFSFRGAARYRELETWPESSPSEKFVVCPDTANDNRGRLDDRFDIAEGGGEGGGWRIFKHVVDLRGGRKDRSLAPEILVIKKQDGSQWESEESQLALPDDAEVVSMCFDPSSALR